MDPIIELTNALADLEQQLRMRQLADEHQRRVTTQVRSQVWQPYASMDYAQYGGTPYLSNHNFGWSHHPNTSWNTSYNTLQSPQVQRSSLEEAMDELRRTQTAFTMEQPEFSRSMTEMDYSQVGLPQFFNPNETSQPPQERMTKLEAALIEMKRVHAECVTSPVQFMELTRANVQIQHTPFDSLKEEMTPMATSGTQLTFEKEQPKDEESMSIEELVAKYMNEQENMATMSFEGQHESSPSTLGVDTEEENWSYNEEITSRGNEELEKLQKVEDDDAETLKDLVEKEEKESTSPESYEKVKEEVVETFPEMTLWGEMHEELKNDKTIPNSEVDEYIIHFNNELRGTIVNKKIKKIENQKNNKIVEDYVLKLLIEHNYRLLEKDGGKKHQPISSW